MNRSLRPLLATTLIFLFAYMLAVTQQPAMLSTRVLGNFLTDNAFLGIAAVGMTFVILSGGIDLSVGAVIGFTTVLVAVLIMWLQLHPLIAFAGGQWYDVTTFTPRPVSVRHAVRRDTAWAGAVVQAVCLWMRNHPDEERSFELATELALAVGELARSAQSASGSGS